MSTKIIDGVEYSISERMLIKCPETYEGVFTIPSTVRTICNRAFRCCDKLTSVSIPDNVTKIGSGVFVRCSGLRNVYIPASVEEIGTYLFIDCSDQLQVYCEAEKAGERWNKYWNIVTKNPKDSNLSVTYGVPRSWYEKFVAQK